MLMASKFSETAAARFHKATVDLFKIFANDEIVNQLESLKGIMVENDPFIPGTIVVRPCMKEFLTRFFDDVEYERKIVIGAPGVGKSVLFFSVPCG